MPDPELHPDAVAAFLRETPMYKEAMAQARAQRLERRVQLVRQIEALRKERDAELPKLREREATAREKAAETGRIHRAALDELAAAERATWNVSVSIEHRIARLEKELKGTADDAIRRLQHELQDLHEQTRRIQPMSVEVAPKHWLTGRPARSVSNRSSILARLEAIGAAYRELERVKLEPGKDLDARLAAIKGSIPPIADPEIPAGTKPVAPSVSDDKDETRKWPLDGPTGG